MYRDSQLTEKYPEDGLFPIIDSCPRLAKLNLTGCRGVRIADRRRFFEVRSLSRFKLCTLTRFLGLGRA